MSITHPIDLEIRHDIEARLSAIEPVQNVRVFSASKSESLGWVLPHRIAITPYVSFKSILSQAIWTEKLSISKLRMYIDY